MGTSSNPIEKGIADAIPEISASSPYHYTDYDSLKLEDVTVEMIENREFIKLKGSTQVWKCTVDLCEIYIHESINRHTHQISTSEQDKEDGAFFTSIEPVDNFFGRKTAREFAQYLNLPTPDMFQGDGYVISHAGPDKTLAEQTSRKNSPLQNDPAYQDFIETGLDQFITDISKIFLLHIPDINPGNILFTSDFEYTFIDIPLNHSPTFIFDTIKTGMHTFEELQLPRSLMFIALRRAEDLVEKILAIEKEELPSVEQNIYDVIRDDQWMYTLDISPEIDNTLPPEFDILTPDPWKNVTDILAELNHSPTDHRHRRRFDSGNPHN